MEDDRNKLATAQEIISKLKKLHEVAQESFSNEVNLDLHENDINTEALQSLMITYHQRLHWSNYKCLGILYYNSFSIIVY